MRIRRLIPWTLSVALHVGLALVLLTTGVLVIHGGSEDPGNALGAQATFSFEAAPTEARTFPESSTPDAPLTVNRTDALHPDDATAATELLRGIRAASDLNRAESLALINHAVRPLEAPRTLVTVAGVRSDAARRVVFLLDASGSMMGAYATAVQEVVRSISRLSGEQQFAVIVFQGGEAILPPPGQLRRAGPTLGQRAIDELSAWLLDEISPRRNSDARAAIHAALALNPDTIVIVSAGLMSVVDRPSDRDELLTKLESLNPRDARTGRRRVQIACVHLMEAEPLGVLESIAKDHGGPGAYRFIGRLADILASDEFSATDKADETTKRLDGAIALLKSGAVAAARTQLLRIGLGEPMHRASAVALVSAAEVSLLTDRDLFAASQLARAARSSARAFGLDSIEARAESVLRATASSPSTSKPNP